MPVGFECRTTDGAHLQLTTDAVFFNETARGSFSVGAANSPSNWPANNRFYVHYELTISGLGLSLNDNPMLAVSCPGGANYVLRSASGGTLVYRFMCNPSQTVTWRLFTTRPPTETGRVGLQLLNPNGSGTLIYTSNTPILKPVLSGQSPSQSITIPSGRTYMFVLGGYRYEHSYEYWWEEVAIGAYFDYEEFYYAFGGGQVQGGAVTLANDIVSGLLQSWTPTNSQPQPSREWNHHGGFAQYLVIDVTND